jgi:hypothetical protein
MLHKTPCAQKTTHWHKIQKEYANLLPGVAGLCYTNRSLLMVAAWFVALLHPNPHGVAVLPCGAC